MAELKLVIAHPKHGKCVQKELGEDVSSKLLGKKIKDVIQGADVGLEGYELEITGGSDKAGFPMRWDVQGTSKNKILAVEGVGLRKKGKGVKQRKTVAGNTIYEGTVQVNVKVLKEGKEDLFAPPKEEPAEGEAPAEGDTQAEKPAEEAPKQEEKTEEPAKEEKSVEEAEKPAEEAPKEEKKEEEKPEEKKEE